MKAQTSCLALCPELLVKLERLSDAVVLVMMACAMRSAWSSWEVGFFFFFKQKTAYEFGLGIPAEPLFRSTPIIFMRASIKMIGVSNLQSFIASMTQKLTLSDISDE